WTTTNGARERARICRPTPMPPSRNPAIQRRRCARLASRDSLSPSRSGSRRASAAWSTTPTLKATEAAAAATRPSTTMSLCPGLAGEAIRPDPNDVPDEADPFHEVDQPARRVDLEPAEAVTSGGRKGVVVVVPGLA